jgi:hypothetical protein
MFEVATTTTPSANRISNSRDNSMASVMSETKNSSKHNSRTERVMGRATAGMGSRAPFVPAFFARNSAMPSCTSFMNS